MGQEKRRIVARTVHDTSTETPAATVIGYAGHGVDVFADKRGCTANCPVSTLFLDTAWLHTVVRVLAKPHHMAGQHWPLAEFAA